MIEWFQSIGNWIVTNKDAIVTTLSAIATSGIGVNLWQFFKNRKIVTENTKNASELVAALKENELLKPAVAKVEEVLSTVKEKQVALEKKVIDSINGIDTLVTKVNAILDVQSLVYQTIKDENTRIAVNNILTNAKYAVTEQRAQLIKELNALKEENARITAESNAKVEESVAKATSIIEATNVETKTVIRG